LFIAVFLFNIAGYYPVFVLRQKQIQFELNQMLNQQVEKETIVKLSFEPVELSTLKWLKENEFSYKGEMYDIIMTEQSEDGKLVFYCYADKKEKHLLVQFEQHVKRHIALEGNTSQKHEKIVKCLVKDYLPVETHESVLNSCVDISYSIKMISYESFFPSKKSPPPKLA
jgi:hypothetical protein